MIALSLTNETKNAMCVTTARGEIVAVTEQERKKKMILPKCQNMQTHLTMKVYDG